MLYILRHKDGSQMKAAKNRRLFYRRRISSSINSILRVHQLSVRGSVHVLVKINSVFSHEVLWILISGVVSITKAMSFITISKQKVIIRLLDISQNIRITIVYTISSISSLTSTILCRLIILFFESLLQMFHKINQAQISIFFRSDRFRVRYY